MDKFELKKLGMELGIVEQKCSGCQWFWGICVQDDCVFPLKKEE